MRKRGKSIKSHTWNRLQRAVVDREQTDLHIFSSGFFTELSREGPDHVRSWTAKRTIDVFTKKLIFTPIHVHLHWCLCVVVNPGAIVNSASVGGSLDDPLACMMILDSMGVNEEQRKFVGTKVMEWLNAEWKRTRREDDSTDGGGPFNTETFPVLKPDGEL
jgi:Ulp1 family protease